MSFIAQSLRRINPPEKPLEEVATESDSEKPRREQWIPLLGIAYEAYDAHHNRPTLGAYCEEDSKAAAIWVAANFAGAIALTFIASATYQAMPYIEPYIPFI